MNRGEQRELFKQRYIDEGKKRAQNKRLRKMGIKKTVDSKERKKRVMKQRLDDHFDMSAATDKMDDNLLKNIHIEDLDFNIDEYIEKEGCKGHIIAEHSQAQLDTLREKVNACITQRTKNKKLGTVKIESGVKVDNTLLSSPKEISIERLVTCTDPYEEIMKTYPNIHNLLGDMNNSDFSTMRAVITYMEPFRRLQSKQYPKKKNNTISNIFGNNMSKLRGDNDIIRKEQSLPCMSRLKWYNKLEELGCRSCHEMNFDEKNLIVIYFHINENVFLAIVFEKQKAKKEVWKWKNYCFLQKSDDDLKHFEINEEDENPSNSENETEELVMGLATTSSERTEDRIFSTTINDDDDVNQIFSE